MKKQSTRWTAWWTAWWTRFAQIMNQWFLASLEVIGGPVIACWPLASLQVIGSRFASGNNIQCFLGLKQLVNKAENKAEQLVNKDKADMDKVDKVDKLLNCLLLHRFERTHSITVVRPLKFISLKAITSGLKPLALLASLSLHRFASCFIGLSELTRLP